MARLPPDPETGAATAEFAVVLPSVVAIAGLVLALGRVTLVAADCHSAASAAARELVVSADESRARSVAAEVVRMQVAVDVRRSERTVQVQVTCPVLPGPMNLTPVQVTGEATAVTQ